MPSKRPVRKGSFASHFDELVMHFFPDRLAVTSVDQPVKRKRKPKISVHQALFERAVHGARINPSRTSGGHKVHH